MASGRLKKSIKNVCYGLVTQVFTVVLNFFARVKFVEILGVATNGLNGLFLEVVAMLSLAELGIGSAITYSLYKPLARKDEEKISQIMWLFKTAYLIIAAVVFVAGMIILPFVHLIVKETSFELSYIRRIFFLFVLRTVSTYLMSYKTSLIIADQKAYVVSLINAVSKIICTLTCVASLIFFESFEIYLIIIIVFNLISNVCVTLYSKKHYSYLNRSSRLPKEECKKILSNIRHVFISKLSGTVTNSTDNVLISVLVNTVATGIYSNYSLVISNVKLLCSQVMHAITGSFGNLTATESKAYCEKTMRNLNFMFFSIGIFLGGGFISASTPFFKIFFKNLLLDDLTLFVCSFNLFMSVWTLPLWNSASVFGLFKEDKFTGIAGSTVNLIVSYILGLKLGMAGIFIGTTCTYTMQMFMKNSFLYKRRFDMSPLRYSLKMAGMFIMAFGVIALEKWICGLFKFKSLWLTFFASGFTSAVITVLLVIIVFGRSDEFKYFLSLCLTRLKKIKERK